MNAGHRCTVECWRIKNWFICMAVWLLRGFTKKRAKTCFRSLRKDPPPLKKCCRSSVLRDVWLTLEKCRRNETNLTHVFVSSLFFGIRRCMYYVLRHLRGKYGEGWAQSEGVFPFFPYAFKFLFKGIAFEEFSKEKVLEKSISWEKTNNPLILTCILVTTGHVVYLKMLV